MSMSKRTAAEADDGLARNYDELVAAVGQEEVDNLLRTYAEMMVDVFDEYMYVDPDDRNGNNCTVYNQLANGYSVREYLDDVVTTEDLVGEAQEHFADDLADDADLLDLADELRDRLGDVAETSAVDELFDTKLRRFLNDHAKDPGFNTAGEDFVSDVPDEIADIDDDYADHETVDDAADLAELDDTVGELTPVGSRIDYRDRDAAFVYVGGQMIVGEGTDTHNQLINRWLDENGKQTISDDYEKRITFSRPLVKQVQRATGEEAVGFGHIVDDMAFIDVTQNCPVDEVKQAVLEQVDGVTKVYEYITNLNGDYARRLARAREV